MKMQETTTVETNNVNNKDVKESLNEINVDEIIEAENNIERMYFITFNPHYENTSVKNLNDNFRYVLQKYYREKLGPRYSKLKNKQYTIGIFNEDGGNPDYIQPHLHILVNIPEKDAIQFYNFVFSQLCKYYPYMTADFKQVKDTPKDKLNVFRYCVKEGKTIISNKDLYEVEDFVNKKIH